MIKVKSNSLNKEPLQTLYFSTRSQWRKWLKKNYKTETGIWLVYYKKESGKPRISYNDAVEEALCFGWIDSNIKKLDSERFVQKFSPRKPQSEYSQANKERLKKLITDNKVMKDLIQNINDVLEKQYHIPEDILHAIKTNPQAWMNYQQFSSSYQRIRIAFIDGARNRPEEFQKRLKYFIKMTEKNKKFGFGGIEKYY
jgi:uncharacterized protein YdeI (YjbR/CyaY-like superfamily)